MADRIFDTRTAEIARLNDAFRWFPMDGAQFTAPLLNIFQSTEKRFAILKKVIAYDDFDARNDPTGEHDF